MLSKQLKNYLATLKIDTGSCAGFEEDALGACIGLIQYAAWSDDRRLAWLTAVQAASSNSVNTLTAGPQNQSFFFHALLNRKRSALGPAVKPYDIMDVDAISYPWVLSEPLFRALDEAVQKGEGLVGRKEITREEIVDRVAAFIKEKGGETAVAGAGWFYVKRFLAKYAPRFAAAVMSEELGALLAVAGSGAVLVENWATRLNNADARANFAIDRKRRDEQELLAHIAMTAR